jgi:hypothetical protein
MFSRDITRCVPKLREIYPLHKAECQKIGIEIALSCTSRDWIEQRALYAQGREDVDMVNHLRANSSLPPITEEQNKRCVTWTLNSKHIVNGDRELSEAYDIFIVKDGKAIWNVKADINDNEIPDYEEVAEIGRKLGLLCGADFKKADYPHFEI